MKRVDDTLIPDVGSRSVLKSSLRLMNRTNLDMTSRSDNIQGADWCAQPINNNNDNDDAVFFKLHFLEYLLIQLQTSLNR